jgi:hypothetical protein
VSMLTQSWSDCSLVPSASTLVCTVPQGLEGFQEKQRLEGPQETRARPELLEPLAPRGTPVRQACRGSRANGAIRDGLVTRAPPAPAANRASLSSAQKDPEASQDTRAQLESEGRQALLALQGLPRRSQGQREIPAP